MKSRFCLIMMVLCLIAATAGESHAYGRYYNGYGRGGPGIQRYYGYGNGPYGNGYGYGYGGYGGYGYGGYGYGGPFGVGVSIF